MKGYRLQMLKSRIALNGTPVTEIRDVTCHMGSHSFKFKGKGNGEG